LIVSPGWVIPTVPVCEFADELVVWSVPVLYNDPAGVGVGGLAGAAATTGPTPSVARAAATSRAETTVTSALTVSSVLAFNRVFSERAQRAKEKRYRELLRFAVRRHPGSSPGRSPTASLR
jgi:hypothetical protein